MAYKDKLATIEEIFKSGETQERSINALRDRARDGILFYDHEEGATQFFKKVPSIILVNAARRSKRPGIKWKDISNAIQRAKTDNRISLEIIIGELSNHKSQEETINNIKEIIIGYL